jgi:tetratricopeptide (TPR) repeat protein
MKLKFKNMKNILLLNKEAESLNAEGNELLNQKKWADAAKRFRAAIEIEPNAYYWSNLALCYCKLDLVIVMLRSSERKKMHAFLH